MRRALSYVRSRWDSRQHGVASRCKRVLSKRAPPSFAQAVAAAPTTEGDAEAKARAGAGAGAGPGPPLLDLQKSALHFARKADLCMLLLAEARRGQAIAEKQLRALHEFAEQVTGPAYGHGIGSPDFFFPPLKRFRVSFSTPRRRHPFTSRLERSLRADAPDSPSTHYHRRRPRPPPPDALEPAGGGRAD
jgi:hypothetical protein